MRTVSRTASERRPELRSYLGVRRCSGGFTPSMRLVSRNDGSGWFFIEQRTRGRGLDDDEDRVADAVGARAAVATTVVSRRSDDAAPVTIRPSLLGVTAVRPATTVLDGTSKLQNVTWSP